MGSTFPSQRLASDTNRHEFWRPENEAEREVIRLELERILASPLFSNSKRYPALLRYVVEAALDGRAERLKERTLGVEVFGRDPAFDTNLDPVVRTSAAQVRQRLAQFYHEPARHSNLQIDLLPGSYVPHFRRLLAEPMELPVDPPIGGERVPESSPLLATAMPPSPLPSQRGGAWNRWVKLVAGLGVMACLLAAGKLRLSGSERPPAIDGFWNVVWEQSGPVVICVPGRFPSQRPTGQATANPDAPLTVVESLKLNSIAWPDAVTTTSLVAFLSAQRRPYRIRRAGDTPLADLREGPAVLVGGYNNSWIMRLTSRLRYVYRGEREPDGWINSIVDTQDPAHPSWKVNMSAPYSAFEEDYGIISRYRDPITERMVVVASGIAAYGTVAAGEFLTTPQYLSMIAERAPKGWARKNIQVVFATKVLNGYSGPPRIVAIHSW